MTNSDESREHAHGATGSVASGLSRRRFLQATGLGAAAAAAAGLSSGPAAATTALPKGWSGTIRDVKHVVILMQENRSFDHYFGTLRGVRGFGDKQILRYPNGTSVFAQPDQGHTQTVTVKSGRPRTISWPADPYGYYDVVITATPAGGFRRRYAGRIA